MSLVGPRPYYPDELVEQQRKYPHTKELVKIVLSVKPGITGVWQVSGRSEVNFDKRIEMDANYVKKQSIISIRLLETDISRKFDEVIDIVDSLSQEISKNSTEEIAYQNLRKLQAKWESKYVLAVRPWIVHWDNLKTFFAFSEQIRRLIYRPIQPRSAQKKADKFLKNIYCMPKYSMFVDNLLNGKARCWDRLIFSALFPISVKKM